MVTERGAWRLEESKCPSRRTRRTQFRQPHLDPWEGNGAAKPGKNFQVHERQEGD